jgi:hypothetical protein
MAVVSTAAMPAVRAFADARCSGLPGQQALRLEARSATRVGQEARQVAAVGGEAAASVSMRVLAASRRGSKTLACVDRDAAAHTNAGASSAALNRSQMTGRNSPRGCRIDALSFSTGFDAGAVGASR